MTYKPYDPADHKPDDVLAGEFVLGVLPIEERMQVEERMSADRSFARCVERWQEDFAVLNAEYSATPVRKDIFPKIEQRLFGKALQRNIFADFWNSIVFWRWVGITSATAALIVFVFALGVGLAPQKTPNLLTKLRTVNDNIDLLASYDALNGSLKITPIASGAKSENSLELWIIPEHGNPISAGIFEPERNGEFVVSNQLKKYLVAGATLAVSREPIGGSPTGQPTGPVIASGVITSL